MGEHTPGQSLWFQTATGRVGTTSTDRLPAFLRYRRGFSPGHPHKVDRDLPRRTELGPVRLTTPHRPQGRGALGKATPEMSGCSELLPGRFPHFRGYDVPSRWCRSQRVSGYLRGPSEPGVSALRKPAAEAVTLHHHGLGEYQEVSKGMQRHGARRPAKRLPNCGPVRWRSPSDRPPCRDRL
jgi:hypothetical protein